MGISNSTARYLAPLSFIINFSAQQYGLFSTPNMQDIHNRHLSFFSPQPYFIGAFFFPQQIIQLAWLYKLWKLDASKSATEKKELQEMVDYVPYYFIGNISIAVWMLFWNSENLKSSNVCVIINSLVQLYYVFLRLPPMNTSSTPSILNYLNATSFAGIGVLDLLHNGAIAFADHYTLSPSTLVKVLTGLGFAGLASASDWIFGGCLVYDLIALAIGQRMYNSEVSWSNLLAVYAVGTAGIVGVKNLLRPPYVKSGAEMDGYTAASTDDDPIA